MQVPKRRGEQFRKRETGAFLVTAETLARLQTQIARLKKELPALIVEVERTKENGDFSENAEYQDAKHALRRMHGRIASIADRLERAEVIGQGANATGTVHLGSTVTLETKGGQVTYTILGAFETNPGHGVISHQSPLGALLLGHSIGDVVTLTTPAGSTIFRILDIQ